MALLILLPAAFILRSEKGQKQILTIFPRDPNTLILHTEANAKLGNRALCLVKIDPKINPVSVFRELDSILQQVNQYLLRAHFIDEDNPVTILFKVHRKFDSLELGLH